MNRNDCCRKGRTGRVAQAVFQCVTISVGVVVLGWSAIASAASTTGSTVMKPLEKHRLSMKNALSMGHEYDTNARKVFRSKSRNVAVEDDMLFRIYYLNEGNAASKRKEDELRYKLQLGAKKFCDIDDEDALLWNGTLVYDHRWNRAVHSTLQLGFKGKEQFGGDGDFLKPTLSHRLMYRFRKPFFYSLHTGYELFEFEWDKYTYHDVRLLNEVGINWRTLVGSLHVAYAYVLFPDWFSPDDQKQQDVTGARRQDHMLMTGITFQHHDFVFLKLGYEYGAVLSDGPNLDADVHKVWSLLGYELFEGTMINLLVSIYYKQFTQITGQQEEERRATETDSEDTTFNTIVLSLSQKVSEMVSFELKVSRYANDFSDTDTYDRYMVNGGMKIRF